MYTYYDNEKNYVPGSGTSRTISIIRKMDRFNTFNQKGMDKVLKVDLDYSYMLKDVTNEKIDGKLFVRNKDYVLFSNIPGTIA